MNEFEMNGFDNPSYIPDSPSKKTNKPTSNTTGIHFTQSGGDCNVTIPISADDGSSIKPAIRNEVQALQQKILRQVLYSILRNSLCYLFAFCLLVLLINAQSFKNWEVSSEVILLMLLCFGLIGIPTQGLHVYRELRNTRRTIVPQMLKRWKIREDFEKMCQARQAASPYLAIEIVLKTGAISCDDPNHWTRTKRKTDKKLAYRVWTDHSDNVHGISWSQSSASWIVLSKDYRTVNRETDKSIQEDIAAFSQDSLYDNYKYFMKRDFILDVSEGEPFPDVQPFLVFSGKRSGFYDFKLYKVMLLLCLDSVYNLLFHIITKNVGEYCIVKYIER